MQQKGVIFLALCLWGVGVQAASVDLLADEQGPTVEGAVETVTAEGDFLVPAHTIPAELSSDEVAQAVTAPVPSDIDILNEIFGSSQVTTSSETKTSQTVQRTFLPQGVQEQQGTMPLLTPLPPLPVVTMEPFIETRKPPFVQNNYADQALAMAAAPANDSVFKMPKEIRVKFYSGHSAFSAQALKWVRSFAVRVVNDPHLLIEIRVSEKNWKVQEKRLSILFQILKEVGVSAHQVRVYKSDRDPDTLLMGYTNDPEQTIASTKKSSGRKTQKTIRW